MKIKNMAHYGDILAIPFFIITIAYFYNIEHKTLFEKLIMSFICICLICDIIFTFIYLDDHLIGRLS